MATSAVTSDAPASSPAPSAPAPAAAVTSAPAPSPAPAVVPVSSPAPAADPGAPASAPPAAGQPQPAEPAKPAGPPQSADFPNTEEGLEDYVEANERWKIEHPEEPAATAAPAPEAAKPAEATKPEETAPEAKPSAATPAKIDEWTSKDPAFKAALDANPALKNELMETARASAAAQPILRLVPTVEDAKFAVDTTAQFIGLQQQFAMAADIPEVGKQALDSFFSLFHVVDDKGQVVNDAAGHPKMTESFDWLTRSLTGGRLNDELTSTRTEAAQLKQKVETAAYPSEAAREADRERLSDLEYDLAAFEYVSKRVAGGEEELELPELSADATPQQRELQEKLRKEVDQANANKRANSHSERAKARQVFETKMNREYAAGIGQYLDNYVTEAKARGEYIPQMILDQPWINPVTGQATKMRDFGMRMALAFKQRTESIPTVRAKLMQLEALGAPGEQARLAYYGELRRQFLPEIVTDYISMLQAGVRDMAGQSAQRQRSVAEVARVEPSSSGAAATTTAAPPTGEALFRRAVDSLKEDPEYQRADRVERAEMETFRMEEIRAGRK